jgi:hypothetical protein
MRKITLKRNNNQSPAPESAVESSDKPQERGKPADNQDNNCQYSGIYSCLCCLFFPANTS